MSYYPSMNVKAIELQILLELYNRFGHRVDTGPLVRKALRSFPELDTSGRVVESTGESYYQGAFRYILASLGKRGEVYHRARGSWEIKQEGIDRLLREGLV
jgi:hypothetical protein